MGASDAPAAETRDPADETAADGLLAHPKASRLVARNLMKAYGGRQVVKDVSIDVRSGEVVGLLGRNGAGKTTCFYMIAGLVPTDGGRIELDVHFRGIGDQSVDDALRGFYKQLIQLRKDHPALRRGDYTLLMQPQDAVLAFARRDAASGDHVLVLANREDKPMPADVTAPPGWPTGGARDALSGDSVGVVDGRIKVDMAPKSVRVLLAGKP